MQQTTSQKPLSLREFIEKPPSHSVAELRPNMKNLDLKVIILTKDQPKTLKNNEVLY